MSEYMKTLRGAFAEEILKKAKNDPSILVVTTDSRGSGSLGDYAKELPEQLVEMGIAEQNAVSVAAGLASMGKKPYVVGPASFYSSRAAEQVKVDVAYNKNNVKILGISGGISYGALGSTHHSVQDIAFMRAVPDLIVEIPSDATMMKGLTNRLLERPDPAYIRVGRGPVPTLYGEDQPFEIGKAHCFNYNYFDNVAIFACGQMVYRALDAQLILEREGIYTRVYDMHTIKPIDKNAIIEACLDCDCILTVEEHSIFGGLGGAVAEVVSQNIPAVPMKILGLPDEVLINGTDEEVFAHYGLDRDGIVQAARDLYKRVCDSKEKESIQE